MFDMFLKKESLTEEDLGELYMGFVTICHAIEPIRIRDIS